MNTREYFSQIETIINDCPIITHFSTEFDEIDQFVGYLKGKLDLMDGSTLNFIEFIEIENEIVNRLKYKYHWQSENGELIERWDNVPQEDNPTPAPDLLSPSSWCGPCRCNNKNLRYLHVLQA